MASSIGITLPSTPTVHQGYAIEVQYANNEGVDLEVYLYRTTTQVKASAPFPPTPGPTTSKTTLDMGIAHQSAGSYTAGPVTELVAPPCLVVITAKLQPAGSDETSPSVASHTKTITVTP